MVASRETWHLFCRVVDNYGDVGIAWRLARQLAADRDRSVRVIVDGVASLARIAHHVDASAADQVVDDVEIVAWSTIVDSPLHAADVVIELLGCGLPDVYLDAMERRARTTWIDYEHLSAEPWVDDFHGRPSPHPTRPLVKHFFYPGFGPRTGGLLIDPDLEARRRAFIADPQAVAAFRHAHGITPDDRDTCHVSLFAYADAPVGAILDVFAEDRTRRWSVVVPEGMHNAAIDRWLFVTGRAGRSRDALSITTIPFVDQDAYDRLLWSSRFNFVRGEDSFVRAQAAARPFVWAPYRQDDDVHLAKSKAFEDRYLVGLDSTTADASRAMSLAWNVAGHDVGQAMRFWLGTEARLRSHAERWSEALASSSPLVDRLVAFVVDRGRSP